MSLGSDAQVSAFRTNTAQAAGGDLYHRSGEATLTRTSLTSPDGFIAEGALNLGPFTFGAEPPEDGDTPDRITFTTYFYLHGQRVAYARKAGDADWAYTWIHSDHLHSATVLTDADGTEIRRLAYAAFGEEIENQGPGDAPAYTYTGKEQDTSGLLYYGARYYDPALARFITPDTMYDTGPQGLNRYSYALNNPIIYRDPTGHYVNGGLDQEEPTCDGCVTGLLEHGGNEMIYHENDDDPKSDHYVTRKIHPHSRGAHRLSTMDELDGFHGNPAPNVSMPDPGIIVDIAGSIACEPYDWGSTVYRWSQGDFSWWDLIGLAPLIPATAGKYVDEVEELVLKASKTDWRIGQRSIKSIVGDATVIVDGVPMKVNPGVQSTVFREKIEWYAKMMVTGKPKKFDWNNMLVSKKHRFKVPGTLDPLIFRRLSNGELQIVEGHHRFIAAKLVGIGIPTYNFRSVQYQDMIPDGEYGKIWENMHLR